MPTKTYRVGMVGLGEIAIRRPGYGLRFPHPGKQISTVIKPEVMVKEEGVLSTPMPSSHAEVFHVLPNTELVAVAELRTELFDDFRVIWGEVFPDVHTYTDFREMIQKEDLDILSVCTPDNAHRNIVVYAANNGVKGIVCEKPLATTVEDCNRMIEACEANGTIMTVEYTRRWMPHYPSMRKAISKGAIGKVRRIVGHLGGARAMLFRNGTHLIDGVCFFAESDPDWVFAELDEGYEDYSYYRGDGGVDPATDPGGSAYIHFKNDVRTFINASKNQTPAHFLQIIGETGEIDFNGSSVLLRNGPAKAEELTLETNMKSGIIACVDELIRVMKEGGEVAVPPRDAKKVVEIMVGFLKSQGQGNIPVKLPLPPGN